MAIKDIRLPDGRDVRIDEWLHWPLYSTIEWASTSAVNFRCFSYVRGQRVPSAGLTTRLADQCDTNMTQRQQMGYDESFIMYAITYEAFGLTSAGRDTETTSVGNPLYAEEPTVMASNLRRLQRDVMIELMLGAGQRKPQLRYTFSFLPQSVGAAAWGSGGNTDPANAKPPHISVGTAGTVHPMNQRRLELPITIESERQMFLKVFAPNGSVTGLTQNLRLRFWLDGMKRRPVG